MGKCIGIDFQYWFPAQAQVDRERSSTTQGFNANWQQHNFPGVPTIPTKTRSDREQRYNQYRELNRHIRYLSKTSKRSSLVILNLPDPNEEESSVDYMQYVQILTEGCPRVMLVHGTGHEVISGLNAVVE